jgi:hypothetical protein
MGLHLKWVLIRAFQGIHLTFLQFAVYCLDWGTAQKVKCDGRHSAANGMLFSQRLAITHHANPINTDEEMMKKMSVKADLFSGIAFEAVVPA